MTRRLMLYSPNVASNLRHALPARGQCQGCAGDVRSPRSSAMCLPATAADVQSPNSLGRIWEAWHCSSALAHSQPMTSADSHPDDVGLLQTFHRALRSSVICISTLPDIAARQAVAEGVHGGRSGGLGNAQTRPRQPPNRERPAKERLQYRALVWVPLAAMMFRCPA